MEKIGIPEIRRRRKENEGEDEIICIREINDNIKRVITNQPLTRPLKVLNRNCKFRKMYDAYCDIFEGDLNKAKMREYRQKPEIKAKRREYYQKNKAKMREYRQKPEVKAKMREYYQKNKAKRREYYQKNKAKWKKTL